MKWCSILTPGKSVSGSGVAPGTPPLDNEEGEFGAIRTMLDTLHLTAQSASVSAALRQGAGAGNFEADLEYLRALQETLERTHGEQH